MKEKGLVGVKLHPDIQRFPLDDKRLMPLFELMSAEGLFLIAHTGDYRYHFSEPFRMEPYSYEGADAYVTANFDHLLAMARGEISFDKLFLSGQIRVDGNLSKGTEIRNLLCRRE